MTLEPLLINHVRPKTKKKHFCRLCGKYDVRNPKAHLRDYHGADYRRTQNKSYDDIVKVLFVEATQ